MWGFLGSAALLLLAGCAHYEARPLAPDRTAAAFASRRLDDPGLAAFARHTLSPAPSVWPPPAWDLTNLTLAAIYFHPDLKVARARWAAAVAGERTAGERPNPTLSVTPAYNTTTAVPSPWLVTPTLDLPLETAGKRRHRQDVARSLAAVARLDLAASVWQVRAGVRTALTELAAATEAEAVLRGQQALQADNLALLTRQQEAGAISAFEMTQARLAADQTRLAWGDAKRRIAEARTRLAGAVGLAGEALEGVAISLAGLEPPSDALAPLAEARRIALSSRPDVLAALATYAAAEATLALEIAKQYPDIHLNPGYEFDQGDNKWSLGLTITLPVLHQNGGAIGEADGHRAEAAARFEALQARVIAGLDRADSACRAAAERQQETGTWVEHLREQEGRVAGQVEAGALARIDLVALRLQLATANLASLDARARLLQALGDWEDAVQDPALLPGRHLRLPSAPPTLTPKETQP